MEPITSLEKGSTEKLSRDRVRVRKCRKRIGGIEKMKNRYFLFIFFSIPPFSPNIFPEV